MYIHLRQTIYKFLGPLRPANATPSADKLAKTAIANGISELVQWSAIEKSVDVNNARDDGFIWIFCLRRRWGSGPLEMVIYIVGDD